MSRVFVVQQPAVFDGHRFVPKVDLSPARSFGELIFLLGPGNIFSDRLDQAIRQLRYILKNYTANDYILPAGDPVAIAATVMIASEQTGGSVTLLKWDRLAGEYHEFPITTNDEA